jgi:NADH-quinone oxidoreductase subunit N
VSAGNLFVAMLPEHLLLAGILLLIGVEVLAREARSMVAPAVAVVAAAAAAACWLAVNGWSGAPFEAQFTVDAAISSAKAVALALTVPVLLMSRDDFARDHRCQVLLLASLYGFCFMVSAQSFLTLFLGIEMMSLPVYVLVLLGMRRPESAEAALKYLVLSGAASATLLMGVTLIYGAGGSLALSAFTAALGSQQPMALGGVVLVLAAFFLKAALVPFHAWAPDAYEGATVAVTAYMATVVKAGVMLAAARLVAGAALGADVAALLAVPSLVSIAWGNLAAMRQDGFRRMIAYSSIAHAGYLFFALLGDGPGRFQAVLFYVLAYGLMNTLALACLPRDAEDANRDRLERLQGLFQRQPFAAVMIALAMLSLAGIPPFPGFVAKFLVFRNVIAAGYTTYAVLGLVASYLGIYFYLRVIQLMFMSPQHAAPGQQGPSATALAAGVLCLVPVLLLTFFPGWVIGLL